jgi:tetratricopeptide (TPR) repeat protein
VRRRSRRAALLILALPAASACVSLAPRSRTPSPQASVVPGIPLATFAEDRCGAGSLALVLGARGDPRPVQDLEAALPEVPGRGVLSVDMLLAARARGFDAALLTGTAAGLQRELAAARPAILMLRLLDAPGARRDIYHYVVADGLDPSRGLFRLQYGDGKARWARLSSIEDGWKAAGHVMLVVRTREETDSALGRALALESERRLDEADALYREVLEVRPDSVRAWVDLGNVAADRGRRAEAETAYRRALAIDAEDRDALNNLAWLLLEEGVRLTQAEDLAARAATAPGPDRPRAQDTLGRIQLARGRCAEAERTFRDALAAEALTVGTRARLQDGAAQAVACAAR